MVLPGHVLAIRLEHETAVASSDPLGEVLAAVEAELGEGPDLDVLATVGVVELAGMGRLPIDRLHRLDGLAR